MIWVWVTINRLVQKVLLLGREEGLRVHKLHLLLFWISNYLRRGISHWIWSCWKSMLELRIRCHVLHIGILTHNSHRCNWYIMTSHSTVFILRRIHMNQTRVSGYESLVWGSVLLVVYFMIKLILNCFLHRTVNNMLASEVVFGTSFWLKLVLIVRWALHESSTSIILYSSNLLLRRWLIHDIGLMLVPHFLDFRFKVWQVSLTRGSSSSV